MKIWEAAIERFGLGLEVPAVAAELDGLLKVFPHIASENERFFVMMKNKLGAQLNAISGEHPDLLSWVKIVKRSAGDWYMFTFEEHNDFVLYVQFLDKIQHQIDQSVLNFFNNNCPEYITSVLHK